VCVCVCVRERERERESVSACVRSVFVSQDGSAIQSPQTVLAGNTFSVCVCV